MANTIDFADKIIEWLLSIDFECKKRREPAEVFDVIEVFKGDHLVLEIKAVDIFQWQENKPVTELENYSMKQSELRKNHIFSVILWEDIWESKPDIVRSRLKAILGLSQRIPARLTYVARIYKATAADFLAKNHLQGSVSSKYRYGLYLPVRYFRVLAPDFQMDNMQQDLLVAVATFSHARIFLKEEQPFRSYELIRFANLLNTTIVGGLNKLLSAFTKESNPDDIMTYVDLEWSDGANYNRLGFEEISIKNPITFFLDTKTHERFTEANRLQDQNLLELRNAGSVKYVRTIQS